MRWSVRFSHKRRTQEGYRKTKCIILTSPRETESLHSMRGPHRVSTKGAGSTKQVGAERKSKNPWASTFIGGLDGVPSKRHEVISLVCLNVTVWGGQKGELEAGASLITLVHQSPEQGANSLFVGMLKQK